MGAPLKTIGQRFRNLRRSFLPRLWSLRLDRRRLERHREHELAASPREEHDSIISSYYDDLECIGEEIEQIRTRRLIAEADRFDITLPDFPEGPTHVSNEHWERGRYSGTWLLKAAGKQLLLKQIRKERNASFEDKARWVPLAVQLIIALGALMGAIIGVILAFKK